MSKFFKYLVLVHLMCWSITTAAVEFDERSTLDAITTALNTGRTANINGMVYTWEKGVIYKEKNGKKRKTRGIKEIVKASVSPMISTKVSMQLDCENPDYRQQRAIALLREAMKVYPNAQYEYSIQPANSENDVCASTAIVALQEALLGSDKDRGHIKKSSANTLSIPLADEEGKITVRLLRIR